MSKTSSEYSGLLFMCPMDREADDCAFVELRKLPLLDRMKHFDSLNVSERETIIRKHKKCLVGREKRVPFSRIAIM